MSKKRIVVVSVYTVDLHIKQTGQYLMQEVIENNDAIENITERVAGMFPYYDCVVRLYSRNSVVEAA